MSVLAVGILLYELRVHGEKTIRVLMTGITIAGVLSGLILFQFWVASAGHGQTSLYLIIVPFAYLGLFYAFKYYRGGLSDNQTGLLLATATCLLGSALGIFFPIAFTVILLLCLAVLDLLLIETNLLERTVGLKRLEGLFTATTIPLAEFSIGLGDILAYSILVTTAYLNGGIYVATASFLLIVLGVFLTFNIARGRQKVAGLPIPVLLGLAPTILTLLR